MPLRSRFLCRRQADRPGLCENRWVHARDPTKCGGGALTIRPGRGSASGRLTYFAFPSSALHRSGAGAPQAFDRKMPGERVGAGLGRRLAHGDEGRSRRSPDVVGQSEVDFPQDAMNS